MDYTQIGLHALGSPLYVGENVRQCHGAKTCQHNTIRTFDSNNDLMKSFWTSVCLSVCPSHAGIVSKRLNSAYRQNVFTAW